jgi:hypothetical protein
MKNPNNDNLIAQVAELNDQLMHFDFTRSLKDQQAEVMDIANTVQDIAKKVPLNQAVEIGGDLVTVGECALNPTDIIGCLRAVIAVLDVVRVVLHEKRG